ncbi:hypothetical protein Tcan_15119 [Toxocara canis]|uniref:Uncharacterized protein n=1 Tax=Toxocara canis TaxID=6265 RepID=A0A0B2VZX8_TOXCA|nr:hypothetical protein Tcan_15119 [Toxocara canis]
MQLALSANGPPGSRLSIATTYPSWQRVRKAYSSIRRKRLKKATAILRNANNKVDHGEHDCDADEPHLKNSFINPVLSNDTTSTNSAPPSTPSEGTDVISSGVDEPEAMSPSHSSKLYSDDDSVVVVSKDCGIHGSLLIPVPDRPQVCGPKNAAKNIETSSLTIKEVLATQMAMKNTTGRHFLVRNPRTGRIIVCDMTDPSDVTQREQSGSDGEDIEERKRIRCDLEEKMNETLNTTHALLEELEKKQNAEVLLNIKLKKATAILRNANNKVDHGEHDCDADEPHLKNSFINPVLSNDTTSTNSAPPSTPSEGTDVISSGVDEPEAMSPSHSSKLYSDDDSVVVVSKDCGIHGSLLIPVPDRPQVCGPKNAAKNIETSSLTIKEVLATQMAMKNTTGRHFLVRNPRTGRIIVCDMTDPSDVTQREQSGSDGEDIEERKRIRCDLEEKMNETLNTTHALLEKLEKKQRDEFNSIGDSVADSLRDVNKVNADAAVQFKCELFEIITKYRKKILKNG